MSSSGTLLFVTRRMVGSRTPSLPSAARYGPHLHDADVKTQLLMVRAEGFSSWAPTFHSDEGATLAVFREPPPYSLVQRMFWDPDSRLCSESWPAGMRSLLHNWDDVFWQLFTVEPADIDLLTRSHSADPTLKMYFVDLDREFPDPSNEELVPVV